jgi:hypothetical protein
MAAREDVIAAREDAVAAWEDAVAAREDAVARIDIPSQRRFKFNLLKILFNWN